MKNYPRVSCFSGFPVRERDELPIIKDRRIRCISRVFTGTFTLCGGPHWSN